jgi:hypothetical protein
MPRKREPTPCPQADKHTPAPAGYLSWHRWAAEMAKDHRQTRCPGCGLFEIWTPDGGVPDAG